MIRQNLPVSNHPLVFLLMGVSVLWIPFQLVDATKGNEKKQNHASLCTEM